MHEFWFHLIELFLAYFDYPTRIKEPWTSGRIENLMYDLMSVAYSLIIQEENRSQQETNLPSKNKFVNYYTFHPFIVDSLNLRFIAMTKVDSTHKNIKK